MEYTSSLETDVLNISYPPMVHCTKKAGQFLHDICAIDEIKMQIVTFWSSEYGASYNHTMLLGAIPVDLNNGGQDRRQAS